MEEERKAEELTDTRVVPEADELPATAPAEPDEYTPSRLPARVLFGAIVILDAVLIHFTHYAPFDLWSNFSALSAGARPAEIFWAAAIAQVLSLFFFCRLAMDRVPAASGRRLVTVAAGLPAWLAGNAAFELTLIHFLGNYADPAGQVGRVLLLAAGAAVALAGLAFFVALGLSEGSGGGRRSLGLLFLRLWPLAVLVGASVIALRHLTQFALVVPLLGPLFRAGFNLWIQLALFGALAGMVRPARPVAPAEPPGLPLALPSVLATILTLLLFIILPPPPFHFDARPTPPLVPDETKIAATGFDDRDRKVTYSSQRMMVIVGQDPFEFGVIDNDRRILLKLLTEPGRAAAYRGISSNLELRGLASLPLGGAGQLLRSRFELWSTPFTSATALRLSAGELIAEGHIGSRPMLVTFSFVDDDVLKVTVDAGARMSLHSTSIALACGAGERFFGLGSFGGTDLRGRDLDLLVEPGGGPGYGGLLRRLTGGRASVAAGAKDAFWPMPLLFFSRGVGVWLAETVDPRVEVASRYPDAVRLSGRGGPLTLYVIRGDRPEDIAARARRLSGPRALPPAAALLPWLTLDDPGSACGAAAWKKLDPEKLSAGYVLVSRAAMGGPGGQCPGLKDFVAAGRKDGFRFVFEDVARIAAEGPVFEEAARRDYLLMNRLGLPLRLLTTRGPQAVVDFTHPAVLKWRLVIWKRMRDLGFEGMALDPLAQVPPEAELFNGEGGETMRNLFPLIYAESASRAWGRSAVLLAEAGCAGMERFVPVLRRGPDETDTYPLLAALGLSGAPVALSRLSAENGFLPLMELAAGPADAKAAERRRRAVETHLRLFPYLYSLLALEAGRGTPPMFPPALAAPQEEFGADSYFLGRGLLVAVPPAGAVTLPVRFPKGGWRQLDTLKFYGAGPRQVNVTGPAAFLAESSIIPLLSDNPPRRPRDLYAEAPLSLLLHPGRESLFRLYDGTELVSRSFPDSMLLEATGETKRDYAWMVLDVPEPAAVFMGGLRQPRQFYDYQDRARLLTLPSVPGPSHRVEVVTPEEVIVDPALQPPPPRKP